MGTGLFKLFKKESSAEEEIKQLVDEATDDELEVSQREIINNVFEFHDTTAGDIMTHRTDIAAVDEQASLYDVVNVAIEQGFSRIPVYNEDLDDILGIIYIKDLLKFIGAQISDNEELKDYIREPLFVPETIPCGKLFAKMTESRIQLAIVVDEYGGTAGLVTMEDILEELVGNIEDEYDEEEDSIQKIDENTYIFEGITDIDDVSKTLKIEIPDHSEKSFMASIKALRLAKGNGYVCLYEYDLENRAVLLERLGKPLSKLDYSVSEQLKLLTSALKQTWDMPLDRTHLNNGLSSIDWFENYVHERKDKLNDIVFNRYNEYLNFIKNSMDESEFVLVHGDGHNNNLLENSFGEFKFIDPDGMYFEKAYDLGVLMREYIDEYSVDPLNLGIKRSQLLSELCSVDEMRIFMWGYLHMVATALILLDMKQDELANKMLFIASKWSMRNS